MRRGIPVAVAVLLVVAAFAAGYVFRSSGFVPELERGGSRALAQSPSPPPASPPGTPGGQRDRRERERGLVTGTIESVQGRTLVLKVTLARGVNVNQGAPLRAEVGQEVQILREIALSDLRRGETVTIRGGMEGGRFVVRQIVVELR